MERALGYCSGIAPSIIPSEAVVVIVEDNADSLFIIADLLEAEVGVGYCAQFASTRELFELLMAEPELGIDLILLDLQIPEEDGYTALAKLQAMPRLAETKIIAVTANVLAVDVERTRNAGFDGFIGKPIDSSRFPWQIIRILGDESVWEVH